MKSRECIQPAKTTTCCAFLILLNYVAGNVANSEAPPVTFFVQLSDIHISRFQHQDSLTGTSRLEDLEIFGDRLLRIWRPDAIVITGDLTDAKSRLGRGEQYKAEWREYKRVWTKMADASGLDSRHFLDVRGNHDAFDNVRGGVHDFYSSLSARATRAATKFQQGQGNEDNEDDQKPFDRIFVDPISPHQALTRGKALSNKDKHLRQLRTYSDVNGSVEGMHENKPQQTTKHLRGETHLSQPLELNANKTEHVSDVARRKLLETQTSASQRTCPTVVMVGIDATPNPGLRNPTNFLGIVGPDLLAQLHDDLAKIHMDTHASKCPMPSVISYGHHTLSTLAYGEAPVMNYAKLLLYGGCGGKTGVQCRNSLAGGNAREINPDQDPGNADEGADQIIHQAAQVPESRVEQVLGRWDATAYLCGHLHDTFGLRTHKIHKKDALPGGGHMAELLLADWKLSRWFRLAVVDKEAGFSFTDLQFLRDLNDQEDMEEPLQLRTIDKGRLINGHVVLITSPADARYSYLASNPAAPGSARTAGNILRAFVLPTHALRAATAAGGGGSTGGSGKVDVVGLWSCHVAGSGSRQRGNLAMRESSDQPWVYEADLSADPGIASCTSDFTVQVVVTGEQGGTQSTSETRPSRLPSVLDRIKRDFSKTRSTIAWPGSGGAPSSSASASGSSSGSALSMQTIANVLLGGDDAWLAAAVAPAPLKQKLSEIVILSVHWPVFGIYAFHIQWGLLVVLLLIVPRLFGQLILVLHSMLHNLVFGTPVVWAAQREPSLSTSTSGSAGGAITIQAQGSGNLMINSSNSMTHDRNVSLGHREPHHGLRESFSQNERGLAAPVQSSFSVSGSGVPIMANPKGCGGCMRSSLRPFLCTARALVTPVVWTSRHCVARPLAFMFLMVLWPLRDLARLATGFPDLWWCLLAFAVNLQFGPWIVGCFGTTIAGWGVMTAHGLWLPGPSGYTYHALHDAPIVTNVHLTTCIIPTVMWLASVVAYWSDQASSSKLQVARLLSWKQIAALFVLVPIHIKLQTKMWVFYGAQSVVLSPSTGWIVPLAGLWLRHARVRVVKSRLD